MRVHQVPARKNSDLRSNFLFAVYQFDPSAARGRYWLKNIQLTLVSFGSSLLCELFVLLGENVTHGRNVKFFWELESESIYVLPKEIFHPELR